MTNAPNAPVKPTNGNTPPIVDVDALTAQALKHTMQTFPPPYNAGAFLVTDWNRGPLLPTYGTKERDRILRIYDQMEYNGIWQGAIAGMIKRVRSTPWVIEGDPYWSNYYQAVFQNAQFGQGWGVFIALLLRDLLTQDYGAFVELIGPGDPTHAISGPLGDPLRSPDDPARYYGIAHKDSWRCYVTGNPTWPVVYYSLMTGQLHRVHHSRIKRFVDQPNPDERYFGIGLCALSRAIGIAAREVRMGRYIDTFLDDKPKPGINTYQGMTEEQFKTVMATYTRQQSPDNGALFGKTLNLFSMDVGTPLKVESIPFSQTPEKFDYTKYVELDVNSIALAIGVDRQEIWELAGRSLGSGAQSAILAQKSEGKFYGDTLSELERFFNNNFLPTGLEFRFKPKSPVFDTAQAAIDLQYAQVAQTLASIPNVTTGNELRTMLANRSETFHNTFTDEQGNVELDDSDIKQPDQEVHLTDDAPPESTQAQPIVTAAPGKESASNKPTATGQAQQADKPAAQAKASPVKVGQKEFASDEQRRGFFGTHPDAANYRSESESNAVTPSTISYDKVSSFLGSFNNDPDIARSKIAELSNEDLQGYRNLSSDRTISSTKHGKRSSTTFQTLLDDEAKKRKLSLVRSESSLKPQSIPNKHAIPGKDSVMNFYGNLEEFGRSGLGMGDLEHPPEKIGPGSPLYKPPKTRKSKDYSATRMEFVQNLIDLLNATDSTSRARFGIIFRANLRRLGQEAFRDGLQDGGVSDATLDSDDLATVQHWVISQSQYVTDFADQTYKQGLSPAEIASHSEAWANKSLNEMYNEGRMSADRNGVYEWVLGRTEKHCKTCLTLNGQRHRFKEWYARDLLPGSQRLACHGYQCDCSLVKSNEGARGRFI